MVVVVIADDDADAGGVDDNVDHEVDDYDDDDVDVDDDVDADGVDVDDAGCQPEVLSATRHAQHDEPGQTHARQPEHHCIVIILIIF